MRQIVLDTETTGLDPAEGHRIVEIGAVELSGHVTTGNVYHQYINPLRDMPAEAERVHGLGTDFLKDFPPFEQIIDDFLTFIGDSKLIIHNAAFDLRFLNAELARFGQPAIPDSRSIDTLSLARRRFPGSPASLDALCRRFGIDNTSREKHGALLDSELLAQVYLELIGGRQPDFALSVSHERKDRASQASNWKSAPRQHQLPPRLSSEEKSAHAAFIEELGENAIWNRRRP
ncbi:MAG: DNA polymerase III subunit epsilon [Pararhodobacter sp.]|nr:DNA polymerase III subunit epsilon [Pararhodobacter sp.]